MKSATESDVREGRAIFYVKDDRSVPHDLGRPMPLAAIVKKTMEVSGGKSIPPGTSIMVVQAEKPDDGSVLIGFRYNGGQGICTIDEIELSD
jgi:hypothetical protein